MNSLLSLLIAVRLPLEKGRGRLSLFTILFSIFLVMGALVCVLLGQPVEYAVGLMALGSIVWFIDWGLY